MDRYVTLIGAEDVRSASNNMQQAANDISRAVGGLPHDLLMLVQRFEDSSMRIVSAIESLELTIKQRFPES